MDIYISMGHVASGVHHCSVEYIYRESGGGKLRPRTNWPICPPMPTLPPGGPRRRHAPLQCGPLSTGQSPSAHQQAPGPLAGAMSPHPPSPGWCPRRAPAPRASCLAPRARPPPLQLPTGPSAGAANSPAAPTGAPCPLPWGAEHRRPPPRPGPLAGAMSPHPGTGGLRTACGAWWRGGRGAGGAYREGHPARAPTVRSAGAPALT